jgi:hypothetical protein
MRIQKMTSTLTDDLALMTADAAAIFLCTAPSWLAKLRMSGRGPLYIKMSRRVYYRRADLVAWIDQRRIRATSQKTEAEIKGEE